MKRKAQNIVEISLLACALVIITTSVFMIYNNQKTSLANMSKSDIKNTQSVSIRNLSEDVMNDVMPYSGNTQITEEALNTLGKSAPKFEMLMSNITYGDLAETLGGVGPLGTASTTNLLTHANSIITNFLTPTYSTININEINFQTLDTLVAVMNYAAANPTESPQINSFIVEFNNLLSQVDTTSSETVGTVNSATDIYICNPETGVCNSEGGLR